MTQTIDLARTLLNRILKLAGLAAGSAALMSTDSDRVFAHQFLAEAPTLMIPQMEYNAQLQIMVKPGSEEPVFGYSGDQLRGKANGEYRVAPLVSKVNTNTNCAVTQGGGAYGSGPRSDCDHDTAND
jgi:hypothetical protein